MNREDESRFEIMDEVALKRAVGRDPEAEIAYHSSRAAQEMDRGLLADCPAAARAHLGLANLHSERLRALRGAAPIGRPPLVL